MKINYFGIIKFNDKELKMLESLNIIDLREN